MFICNDCEGLFEEYETYTDRFPYGDTYATENNYVCPFCDSNDFEEAIRCNRCGDYIRPNENKLCDVCYEEMYGEN